MKIASWNVNSLKVRLPHLLDWLREKDAPDIIALQELKLEDRNFPAEPLLEAGYQAVFCGQKTYNGVALLIRSSLGTPRDIQRGNPLFPDPQQRLIAAGVGELRVISAYFPNGEALESSKFAYKLSWMAALTEWLKEEIARYPLLALCGDFNIAPEDADVYAPEKLRDSILCSPAERQAFRALLSLGLKDSFRLFPQPEKSFSQWDYRMACFQKNHGWRIDHILLSEPLRVRARAAGIDRHLRAWERPSDHAPIWVSLGN